MDGGSTWGPSNDVAIAGEGKISLQRDLAMAARVERRGSSRPTRVPKPARSSAPIISRSPRSACRRISFRSGEDLEKGGVAAGKAASDEYNERRYHQPGDEWSSDVGPEWRGAGHRAALHDRPRHGELAPLARVGTGVGVQGDPRQDGRRAPLTGASRRSDGPQSTDAVIEKAFLVISESRRWLSYRSNDSRREDSVRRMT